MNLQDVRDRLRSEGIVRDEPGQFYKRWLRGRPYACGPDGVKTSTWFMETTEEERLAQAEMWLTETGSVAKALFREIPKGDGTSRGIASFDRSYQAACYAVAEVVGPVIESVYSSSVVGSPVAVYVGGTGAVGSASTTSVMLTVASSVSTTSVTSTVTSWSSGRSSRRSTLVVDGLLHEVSSLVDASFTEPPRQPGRRLSGRAKFAPALRQHGGNAVQA